MRNKLLILAIVIGVAVASTSAAQSGGRRRGASNSQEVDGSIKTVSATSIVIVDEHGKEFTIALTPSTSVRKGEQKIAVADLKTDDRVEVKVTMNGNTLTALLIEVKQPENDHNEQDLEGAVVTVSSDSLTIRDALGKEVKIALTSSTVIRKGNQTITVADLKKDDVVEVKATMSGNTLTALLIEVRQGEENHDEQDFDGAVVTASPDSLTIRDKQGKEVKIALTLSTIIRKGNQKLTAADLKKDDRVHVKTIMVNNVLTALEVIVGQQDDNDEEGEH